MRAKKTVLFVCTGNACRSQMAEALLRYVAPDSFVSLSAGTRPAGMVHPIAVQTLHNMGVSTDDLESKHWEEFLDRPIDICITVCDNASAECPTWPGQTVQGHWALPDPAFFAGTEEERLEFAQLVADRILAKVTKLSKLPLSTMSPSEISDRLELLAEI